MVSLLHLVMCTHALNIYLVLGLSQPMSSAAWVIDARIMFLLRFWGSLSPMVHRRVILEGSTIKSSLIIFLWFPLVPFIFLQNNGLLFVFCFNFFSFCVTLIKIVFGLWEFMEMNSIFKTMDRCGILCEFQIIGYFFSLEVNYDFQYAFKTFRSSLNFIIWTNWRFLQRKSPSLSLVLDPWSHHYFFTLGPQVLIVS